MTDTNQLGQRLREIRKQKKISGHQVAEYLGIAPGAYYKYERGERSLSLETAEKLARLFDCSVDYLVGLTDDPGGHFHKDKVNIKELLKEEDIQFHWDGIPLGEKELKATLEVLEYFLWKKIRGKSEI